jgi:hypothetical protein
VPLPRGCSASRWLRGQDAASHHQVYFAGRHSTAPETPKSALAEAAARGWSAAAGLGAAWLWRGDGGVPFGEEQLTGVQRMLSEAQPRIRVLGGTRWGAASGRARWGGAGRGREAAARRACLCCFGCVECARACCAASRWPRGCGAAARSAAGGCYLGLIARRRIQSDREADGPFPCCAPSPSCRHPPPSGQVRFAAGAGAGMGAVWVVLLPAAPDRIFGGS